MSAARRRQALAAVLVAGLVLVAAVAWRAASIAGDLREAKDLIDGASQALADGRLADADRALGRAEDLLLDANEALRGSFELALAGFVPGVRQNLDSLEDSVAVAATVVHGGTKILSDARPLQAESGTLEVSLSDGSIPLAAVAAVHEEMVALSEQLALLDAPGDSSLLLSPIRDLSREVRVEVDDRSRQLDVLGRGLDLLHQLAGGQGPRRYLLAVANTAEMRGSGGMILNYGVLEGRDGTIDLTAFGRIDELDLSEPVSSELVPTDYLQRWSGFEPLARWRQANLSGDFTVIAPVLEAMYTAATRLPVNGVIQIDPSGLAAILEGVGPVTVPELGEVRSDNVVQLTLNEAYIRLPDVESRTDVLGDVAEAAFRKLVDGEVPSLRGLAAALGRAVDGGHVLAHASSLRTQDHLEALGADGAYPPLEGDDAFALTVQNLSGTKLDYYLDTSVELTGERQAGELGDVQATIQLANTAPPGATQPRYIFGPLTAASPTGAGVARSLVTLYLPLGATVTGSAGDTTLEPVSSGLEAGRPYASYIVDVPAGATRSVTLALRLAPRPDEPYRLLALPAPRVRPTLFSVDLATEDGPVRGTVPLDRRWAFSAEEDPVQVPAPAYR